MNPNKSESNDLFVQSQKEDKIGYLVQNGFDKSNLEGLSLSDLKAMVTAKIEEKYEIKKNKYNNPVLNGNSTGGKSKRKHSRGKSKRKHSRGKRKGSRRHKTRRHFKK